MNPNFGRPVSVPLQRLRLWWPVAFVIQVSTYSLLSPQTGTLNLPQLVWLGDPETCRAVVINLLFSSPLAARG